jgi:hypothetical protein
LQPGPHWQAGLHRQAVLVSAHLQAGAQVQGLHLHWSVIGNSMFGLSVMPA